MSTNTETHPPSIKPGRRPGRPKSSVNREHFLDAAVQLFGEKGIAATTLADIAKHMGVTSAMVHYYFTNREQLLDAVVEERLVSFIDEIWGAIDLNTLDNPKQAVLDMSKRLLQGILTRPWIPSLWFSDIASKSGELGERVDRHLPLEKIQAMTKAIRDAQTRGEINQRLQAHLIFPTIVGLILLPLADQNCAQLFPDADNSLEAVSQHIEAMLTGGLQPRT